MKLFKLTEAIINLHNFTSNNDTRAELNKVYFSKKNSEVVATDGHVLGRVGDFFITELDNDVFIPGTLLKKIKSGQQAFIDLKGSKLYIKDKIAVDLESCIDYEVDFFETVLNIPEFDDLNYPDYIQVVPSGNNTVYKNRIGTQALKHVLDYMIKTGALGIDLDFADGLTGILTEIKTCNEELVKGLIMPMKRDNNDTGIVEKSKELVTA